MWKIHVNSKSTGKYSIKNIEGVDHIVAMMRPIVGDSVMNQVFYPDEELGKTFDQLDNIPAPNGHPKLGGQYVPANHPVANNKHNVGGFIQNPRKDGKEVYVDFLLNLDVANRTEEGQELVNRIKSGEKVGVSTGLTVNLSASNNENYKAVANNFRFDHVAVLLDEPAAGEHVGTELVLNKESQLPEAGEMLCNAEEFEVNELSDYDIRKNIQDQLSGNAWLCLLYPESKTFIYEIEGGGYYKRSYSIDENEMSIGSI